jgi:hypothetical protein
MNDFSLIQNIVFNNFVVDLYTFTDYSGSIVSNETIQEYIVSLNNQETAIELAQLLSSFDGVKKISIYNPAKTELLLEVAESL